jgi:isopenicillin N synthase-like dioxygenase
MASSSVPLIDISKFDSTDPEERREVVESVSTACREIGFLLVTGTQVPAQIEETTVRECNKFFGLELDEKLAVCRPDPSHIRGYSGVGTEALSQLEKDRAPPDLKEVFDVGPYDLPAEDDYFSPEKAGASFAPNVWPKKLPSLRPAMSAYFLAMEDLAEKMARIFALALELPESYFLSKIDRHISILRANFYAKQLVPPLPNQLRGGGHTDYTAYTILWQQEVPGGGLQVRDKHGEWIDVPVIPGSFVVNIGDSLARWTNDLWVSTMHRVVNPPPEIAHETDRLSLVFFFQPNYDAIIECIETCQGPDNPAKYAPIANGDYLAQKFAEQQIGAE